jgi:hypothetical protein
MDLQERLAAVIERKRGSGERMLVDLRAISDFSWDTLYIFTPYTPIETVRDALGFDWPKAAEIEINKRDDINLLVFVSRGEVVQFLEYPRSRGDFYKVREPYGLACDEAVFEVKEEDHGQPWLVLYALAPAS